MQAALGINPDQTTPQINADLDHLQALGVTVLWQVLDVSWAFPTSTTIDAGVATKLDACVNGAIARGMQVSLQAQGMPTWITAASGHTANVWHGPDTAGERTSWVACLHAAINRWGSTKITWVNVWNEPNLPEFWVQGISAGDYMRLLQACYVDIKGTWPTIKVIGHNLARNDIGWIQDAYAWSDIIFTAPTSAANDYYHDVVGIHPYAGDSTSGWDPADNSHADQPGSGGGVLDPNYVGYRRIQSAVVAKEGAAKPFAVSEFGYATLGSGWFKVSEATRAAYVTSAYSIARADGYFEYFNLYYHRFEALTTYANSFNIHGTTTETAFSGVALGGITAGALWTFKLEIAFATQPMATTPTWTDVSQYLLGVNPVERTWGKTDEFNEVDPSALALVLNNRDGRFTRGLVSSPYYPNVRNGRRVRLTLTRNAVPYVRFDGHINGFPTSWVMGVDNYAWCSISATDRLKRFSERGELRSMLEEEVLRDAGTANAAYYPLSEPDGSISAASITPTVQGPARRILLGNADGAGDDPAMSFGQGTGPGTDGLSALRLKPAATDNGRMLDAPLYAPVGSTTGTTLEAWFLADTGVVSRTIASLEDKLENRLRLAVDNAGKLAGIYTDAAAGANQYTLTSAGVVSDKATHHAALTESRSGSTVTARLYFDGVQVATTTRTAPTLRAYNQLRIGGRGNDGGLFSGTLSHIAAYSTALAAARILEHFNAGDNGLVGERTDQRIARIADWIGIPTADRVLDVGDSTVGAQSTSGKQPVEAMREIEATESGVLYVNRSGQLTFHNRSRRFNINPAITINAATQLVEPLEYPGDDFGLTNDMTVTRPGGAPARAVNQASISEYGLYRDSKEIVAETDTDTQGVADWRVQTYGEPRTRIPNVTVDIARLERVDPTQVALILAADIGTKIRLTNIPTQAPTTTADLFIEGGTEEIGARSWRITFNTSPADYYQVWELGIAGFTELGLTTRLGL